jgi:hypothetical protein
MASRQLDLDDRATPYGEGWVHSGEPTGVDALRAEYRHCCPRSEKLGATRQVFCTNDSGLTARINQWVVSVESAAYLCDVRHTASVP